MMGYTLKCMVLAKKDYFSETKKKQMYNLDVYDGNDKVTILDVPQDIYGTVVEGEHLTMDVKVRAYARDGRGSELIVVFVKLV